MSCRRNSITSIISQAISAINLTCGEFGPAFDIPLELKGTGEYLDQKDLTGTTESVYGLGFYRLQAFHVFQSAAPAFQRTHTRKSKKVQ
jgi:hypothetical protein